MTGFRNMLVHEYQEMDLDVFIDIIQNRLDDFVEFTTAIISAFVK